MGFSRQWVKIRLFPLGFRLGLCVFGGAVEQFQGEITAQEQWDAGADIALPGFEIFFRLFKLLLLSEMESAWPTHPQLSLQPQDPVSIWQRHRPQEEHVSPLKLHSQWACRKASGSAVYRESSITEGLPWVGQIPMRL